MDPLIPYNFFFPSQKSKEVVEGDWHMDPLALSSFSLSKKVERWWCTKIPFQDYRNTSWFIWFTYLRTYVCRCGYSEGQWDNRSWSCRYTVWCLQQPDQELVRLHFLLGKYAFGKNIQGQEQGGLGQQENGWGRFRGVWYVPKFKDR